MDAVYYLIMVWMSIGCFRLSPSKGVVADVLYRAYDLGTDIPVDI